MFNRNITRSDLTLLTIASAAMTLPFVFFAKDIANSLRSIANRNSQEQ